MRHLSAKTGIVGEEIMHRISSCCEKVDIAGSYRRGSDTCKDVEILASPKYHKDLFGKNSHEDDLLMKIATLMSEDVLVWRRKNGEPVLDKSPGEQGAAISWGRKYIPMVHKKSGVPVDLFIVRPPSNYFWQLIIRTGPKEFSKRMVIHAKKKGCECRDGAVWVGSEMAESVEFGSEKEVFDFFGMEYVEPKDRR